MRDEVRIDDYGIGGEMVIFIDDPWIMDLGPVKGCQAMIDSSPETYHKELDQLSLRLQALKEDFQEHGMFSDADQAVLERVRREKDDLAVKLSDAERSGHWDVFKETFGRVWNSFIVDLEMLELRLMDADMMKQRKA
jgi:hypothetical protein